MKTLVVALALLSASAWGHSGGTNSSGCHNVTATGGYHCHGGGSYGGSSKYIPKTPNYKLPKAKSSKRYEDFDECVKEETREECLAHLREGLLGPDLRNSYAQIDQELKIKNRRNQIARDNERAAAAKREADRKALWEELHGVPEVAEVEVDITYLTSPDRLRSVGLDLRTLRLEQQQAELDMRRGLLYRAMKRADSQVSSLRDRVTRLEALLMCCFIVLVMLPLFPIAFMLLRNRGDDDE